jgi:SAM-dependent methyltransferase
MEVVDLNDSIYNSRFIRVSDPKTTNLIFSLPDYWWSRIYEYEWAAHFVEKEDVSLDAACGLCHPFKFFLKDNCKEAHACDIDPGIKDRNVLLKEIEIAYGKEAAENLPARYLEDIDYRIANLAQLPYESGKFDKVYCISVLEHLSPKIMEKAFSEFARVLKADGMIVLTFDYPAINLKLLEELVRKTGLKFHGEVDFEMPEDALYTKMWGGIYCFRALLSKLKR